MKPVFLKRSFFQRLLGRCATPAPGDPGSWAYTDGRATLRLAQTPELEAPGGAVRLEGMGLPKRVLVVHGEDGQFRAFHNRCAHAGRRLDPVPGQQTIQCCSVNASTYGLDGQPVYGPAKGEAHPFSCTQEDGTLIIQVVEGSGE